jgi:hypothetical protein
MTENQQSSYTVEADSETGKIKVSIELTEDELRDRIKSVNEEDVQEIGKIWWCVRCASGLTKSVRAYTEIDAGFGVCWMQSFSVSRGKCS